VYMPSSIEDLYARCQRSVTEGFIGGCLVQHYDTDTVFRSVEILIRPESPGINATAVHELGHALGFAHIFPPWPHFERSVEAPDNLEAMRISIMGGGTGLDSFSTLDTDVLRAVYAAGLHAGSSRAQLRAAGLIHLTEGPDLPR